MQAILAINVGSSTIKFALFKNSNGSLHDIARGNFKHIGQNDSAFNYTINNFSKTNSLPLKDQANALEHLAKWLAANCGQPVDCITHRLVHGGPSHYEPQLIDEELLKTLQNCIPFAPDHLPNAITAIRTMQLLYTGVRQVACFDTAFHQHLPPVAKTLPLGGNINHCTLHKYGFHGLSYEYIYTELASLYADINHKKIVIAHLGNGASMAAVKNGHSVDTTMGFTPTGGLVMGSRTGDIDPGILTYLLQQENYTPEKLNRLINHESGLKGISGLSSDMQVLREHQSDNLKVRLAIDIFCYQATKHLGALTAVMGGIDLLVFTGGIGASAPIIRSRICSSMGFAGIKLDETLNAQNQGIISASNSAVGVHVMETDEERQMAKHAVKLTAKKN